MPILKLIKKLKNWFFARLRESFYLKKTANLHNFLNNIEVLNATQSIAKHKILVLCPHPDDEALACGGTLKRAANAGGQIDIVYLTSGEKGVPTGTILTRDIMRTTATLRQTEAMKACEKLGIGRSIFLNGKDGELHLDETMWKEILDLMNQADYDYVFCPWIADGHSDHAATFRILCEALEKYKGNPLKIWQYEVWSPLMANQIVNIDSTIRDKIAAIEIYESQVGPLGAAERFRALALYRGLLLPQAKYVEAFIVGGIDFTLKLNRLLEPRSETALYSSIAQAAASHSL